MKEVLAKAESKMGKTIARLESDYAAIRAGRANPAVLDKVMVDYYGAPTPVNQLAAVSVAEARVLTIQPWDGSVCRAIERAIQTSDIGINPQSDGKTIPAFHSPRRYGKAEGDEERRRTDRGRPEAGGKENAGADG